MRRFEVKRISRIALIAASVLWISVTATLAFIINPTSGSGSVTGPQAAQVVTSTVSLSYDGNGFVYVGGNTSALVLGGGVLFGVNGACTSGCPGFVSTVALHSEPGMWSSNKAGCDEAAMPGSFSATPISPNLSVTASSTRLGQMLVNWNNLVSINQTPCAGAIFTFNLVAS